MPLIMKLEAFMGAAGAIVHPTMKAIYETMSEVDTADIKVDGVNKLLNYPEYSDVSELKDLLGVLEQKDRLMDVIETQTALASDGIHVYIGAENSTDAMKNTTLIFKDVFVGGKKLSVGVIGPKRMNYSKVIDMINRLAFGIDRMFNEEPGLPEPKDKY